MLAEVLRVDRVSADSNFFDDLGADSLTMARFCARVRKRPDLPSASIKDVYEHPTITRLAAELAGPASAEHARRRLTDAGALRATRPVGTLEYVLCGALQLLVVLGYSYLVALVLSWGYSSIVEGSGVGRDLPALGAVRRRELPRPVRHPDRREVGARRALASRGASAPGAWRTSASGPSRPWSAPTRSSCSSDRRSTSLYLRALGAKIGRNVTILSRHVPVCTDLLEVGDGAVIRKDSFFNCYRAAAGSDRDRSGNDRRGRVRRRGDGPRHRELAGRRSPARPLVLAPQRARPSPPASGGRDRRRSAATDADYRGVEPLRASAEDRRLAYGIGQLRRWRCSSTCRWPRAASRRWSTSSLRSSRARRIRVRGAREPGLLASTRWSRPRRCSSAPCSSASLVVLTVPRVLNLAIEPDRTYPLYGFHYGVHRAIARITNVRLFPRLFGDSSYIVHYLRGLGYDLSAGRADRVELRARGQARDSVPRLGRHAARWSPTGCRSSTPTSRARSFRVSRATIGAQSFLGNYVGLPVAEPNRRRLPAGDQGDGAGRRRASARTSACSARPASRSRARSSATAGSTT